MLKKLATIFISTVLSAGMVMSSYASQCPYCDTECVRELDERMHHFLGYGNAPISHAEALFTNTKKLAVERGLYECSEEEKAKILSFDGNPMNLGEICGSSNFANGRAASISYKVDGLDGIFEVNFETGKYKRFDGNTYSFDPALFAEAYDVSTLDCNVISYIYGKPCFVDWMAVNNQNLPQPVIDRLEVSLQAAKEKIQLVNGGASHTDQNVIDANKRKYENLEIALEMLYGLYPMDGSTPESSSSSNSVGSSSKDVLGPGSSI